jgi:hypothetical protein
MEQTKIISHKNLLHFNPIEILEGEDKSTSVSTLLSKKLKDAGYHSLETIVVMGAQLIFS